jgi:serine/threonine protein kinase
MLDLAAQKEEKERVLSLRRSLEKQPHLPNGGDHVNTHPDDIQARFHFRRRLGRGSFGDVSEVEEMSTEQVYARKMILFEEGSLTAAAAIKKKVANEVHIMQKLRHQHIATVLFFVREPGAYSILMLPVADSDLLCYLERCIETGYPFPMIKRIYPWFGCLLDALAYAHKLHISHRDIKPSNVLIKDGQLYLSDFGVAKDLLQETSASGDYFVKGTPVYRAPEAHSDHPPGYEADIFALGCLFAEMLTVRKNQSLDKFREWRRAPDNPSGVYAFRANLARVHGWIKHLHHDSVSEQLADLMMGMLNEDPDERPTAQQGLNQLKSESALFCESH